MTNQSIPAATTAMMIRKPVDLVFNAFVDPAITSQFWFTKGTNKLVEGQVVIWTWEMYNVEIPVTVLTIVENQKIGIEWGNYQEKTIVDFEFKVLNNDKTFVTITNYGFQGTSDTIIKNITDSVGGFTWVLAGLKSYLEHGLNMNFIADRFPK
ncbi:SRPBCC family protein [Flavobacterium agrisoli]|uniref:SRPBCC family protein n=1 Tax=Flavobacterium agrisoli TaxID=2793066 RepID=A0A934PN98_9FLAO|nr:SRPBCC family protein [Flavobacterium agrisoli]MBK0369995.1 SRPBCC family protein [Flavobacterium agrisoli]